MSESPTPEELDAQLELRRTRFAQVTAEIRTVLREDVSAFIPREAKRAFLTQPAVADAMSADDVSRLKARSAQVGAEVAAAVDAALSDLAVWQHEDAVPENRRDISGSTRAWACLDAVGEGLSGLLSDFGLAMDEGAAYRAPTYFVKGLYLPSLSEHYWRLVQEIRELEGTRARIESDAVRSRLEAKWDAG